MAFIFYLPLWLLTLLTRKEGISVLDTAVLGGYPSVVLRLLHYFNESAPSTLREELQRRNVDGKTALHHASSRELAGIVEILRHFGAISSEDNVSANREGLRVLEQGIARENRNTVVHVVHKPEYRGKEGQRTVASVVERVVENERTNAG